MDMFEQLSLERRSLRIFATPRTFVISAREPGVWNWIDTQGLHMGLFVIRWQGVPAGPLPLESAVRDARVVRHPDLMSVLPPETSWAGPEERAKQQAERLRVYQLRLANG